jgi:hypothetical protein
MKIVDRQTFLAMPVGTVYAKFSPLSFGDVCIKDETVSHDGKMIDWWYVDFTSIDSTDTNDWMNKLEDARIHGTSVPMDFETISRDGLFDADQLFAVFERADADALIARLERAIDKTPIDREWMNRV